MKKINFLFYLLMSLPLIVVIITLPLLPDKIPAHYDLAGNITRWGSKYEKLIFPITAIGMGIFLKVISKVSSKSEENKSNEKVIMVTAIAILILFSSINLVFLYKDYCLATGLKEIIKLDTSQIVFILLGIFFIIIGVILPKCKMNSMVGVRTKWSMENEKAWNLSQRGGGVISIIIGLIMIAGNLFIFKGGETFFYSMLCMIVDIIVTIFYTKVAYKKSMYK